MYKELISQILSNPQRFFRRTFCRNLPRIRMMTYGDIVPIQSVAGSLPALKSIFDEPYISL